MEINGKIDLGIEKEIPVVNLKLESRTVESRTRDLRVLTEDMLRTQIAEREFAARGARADMERRLASQRPRIRSLMY